MFIVSQIYPLSTLIFIDDKIVKIGNMYKKKKKKKKGNRGESRNSRF